MEEKKNKRQTNNNSGGRDDDQYFHSTSFQDDGDLNDNSQHVMGSSHQSSVGSGDANFESNDQSHDSSQDNSVKISDKQDGIGSSDPTCV